MHKARRNLPCTHDSRTSARQDADVYSIYISINKRFPCVPCRTAALRQPSLFLASRPPRLGLGVGGLLPVAPARRIASGDTRGDDTKRHPGGAVMFGRVWVVLPTLVSYLVHVAATATVIPVVTFLTTLAEYFSDLKDR